MSQTDDQMNDEHISMAYKLGFDHGRASKEPEHEDKYYLMGHEDGKHMADKFPSIYKVQEENVVGAGDIAGVGVGDQGEPGVNPKDEAISAILIKYLRRKST